MKGKRDAPRTDRPRVLLDCDGILADFVTPLLGHVNKLMGTNHQHDDVDQWDVMEALDVPEDIANQAYSLISDKDGCFNLPIYPGATRGVFNLQQVADVYIVTSPMHTPHWADERRRWLNVHFSISHRFQVSTSAKHTVAGDFLVDDKIETLWSWSKHFPNGVPIAWDLPSNKFDVWPHTRISTWETLVGFVRDRAPAAVRHRVWANG